MPHESSRRLVLVASAYRVVESFFARGHIVLFDCSTGRNNNSTSKSDSDNDNHNDNHNDNKDEDDDKSHAAS